MPVVGVSRSRCAFPAHNLMEQTFEALAQILLKSIPTVGLLIFLYFFLRAMLFAPLTKVLKERDELTSGTRNAAEASLREAERNVQEYDAKLRDARTEIYREQEATRAEWLAEQAAQVSSARLRSAGLVARAKQELAGERAAAEVMLMQHSSALADEIAMAVLGGKTA